MRIDTRTHGILDYGVGFVLIIAPYVFGFSDGSVKHWLPMLLGVAAMIYSLFTRYELGAFRFIPMPVHLGLDILSGLLLAASPWLFGFAGQILWPHVAIGIFEIVAALMTGTVPVINDDRLERPGPSAQPGGA